MKKRVEGGWKKKRDRSLVLLGAGGHARVLLEAWATAGEPPPSAALDPDRAKWKTDWDGVPVLGGEDLLPGLVRKGARRFLLGLGGAGDNGPRRRLFEKLRAEGMIPVSVRHPSAVVSKRAEIGPGCQILAASVVNAGAVLGKNVIVNSGALVEHDCVLEDHVHVASGAVLASGVRVGAGAHIGAGAVARQGISVGAGAVVGIGAAVVKDVPAGAVVVGVPARPLRKNP